MTGPAWLLIVGVLLGPLAIPEFGASKNLMEAKNAMFIHAGLGATLLVVRSWWVRAFLAWAWLSFLLSGMRGWAFLGLLGIIAWALLHDQAGRLTETGWRSVCWAVTVAAGFQMAWMVVQALGYDGLFRPITWGGGPLPAGSPIPAQGWFGNPADAAVFLGLSLPAMMAVHPVLLLPTGIAVLSLRSTAGFVCVGIAAAWWLLRYRPCWLLAALPVAAVVTAVQFLWLDPQGLGWRPLIWSILLQFFAHRPWLGWGPNALEHVVIIDSPVGRWNFGFSEWLQGGMELGIGAVLIAAAYVGWQAWRLRSRWRLAGVLVPAFGMLVAISVFSIPFRIGPVALLAALYLGRLDAETA